MSQQFTHLWKAFRQSLFATLLLLLVACGRPHKKDSLLVDVREHLPDLNFSLTSDEGHSVNAQDFKGRIVLVYFGYTHCPDVCPEAVARLMQVFAKLEHSSRDVRVLFISVDPERDSPEALHSYVRAFDSERIIGLTGTPAQIEEVARRYRVAYQQEQKRVSGSYEVMHSSAIYLFDAKGRARFMATSTDSAENIAHDLCLLLRERSK